jgi:Outer membrane protein beta-barrel domain
MKLKLQYFLIILLGIPWSINSANLSLGIKTGIELSDLYGPNSHLELYEMSSLTNKISIPGKEYPKIAPMVGGYIGIEFNEYILSQIGLYYLTKGKYFKGHIVITQPTMILNVVNTQPATIINVEGDLDLDYLELPILLIFKKRINSLLAPFIYFGISGSCLVYEQDEIIVSDPTDKSTFKDNCNLFDLGFPMGIGTEVLLKKQKFEIEIGYNPCLLNIAKGPIAFLQQPGAKNQCLYFLLGYSLQVRKH